MTSFEPDAIRILLADNRSLMRIGLQNVLSEISDIAIAGEATDCGAAADQTCELTPDIVVVGSLDDCPESAAATQRIARTCPARTPAFLILTEMGQVPPADATAGRPTGVLFTNTTPDQLISAIRMLFAGYSFFNRSIVGGPSRPNGGAAPERYAAELEQITAREFDMLYLMARGCTNAEISQALAVGESTVKSHVQSLFNKLGLRNRVAATIYAYENGVVRVGDANAAASRKIGSSPRKSL
jgi:DNA-binding NarL/FixJ family response regulator